jgi:hypothetical protein
MDSTIRMLRVAALLVLATLALSFVVGAGRPETGLIEKVALAALVVACIYMATKVRTLAAALQVRLHRR